ncbi:protein kinase C delta type-like [Engystomops pustulosus]|uniref:protein kinase C delta type-like n=1 Tax=Engystomops pustulosus TaxID=76066 RepID=UPI003AFAD875
MEPILENPQCLPKKRKGGWGDEAPKKAKRKKKVKRAKRGADIKSKVAPKRPGSPIMEGVMEKRKRGEEMEGKNTDMPPKTAGAALPDTNQAPNIVSGLDSFTFHELLGEGGYGKVMLATHNASKKQVAVKMMKKRLLLQDFHENVLIERQVLEMTGKSPLFTQAYATFHTQDYVFFIMEYLSGGDLRDLIWAKAPLTIPLTRFFAAEVICGLQFLHSRGIIHRDIKPENMLLDSVGHLKIADFGLSVTNIFGNQKITEYAGTLSYMAPEILEKRPYNAAVDYFAAGVTIYEMATKQYPFYTGQESRKIELSLIKDDPSYPKDLNPQIKDILEGLLNKSPERRQVAVDNIREHPFFLGIQWKDIESATAHPPLLLKPRPVKTSQIIDHILTSTEANKPQMAKRDKKLFSGFTFANDGWKIIKPIQEPVIQHRRTFGRLVRRAFYRLWSKIQHWA